MGPFRSEWQKLFTLEWGKIGVFNFVYTLNVYKILTNQYQSWCKCIWPLGLGIGQFFRYDMCIDTKWSIFNILIDISINMKAYLFCLWVWFWHLANLPFNILSHAVIKPENISHSFYCKRASFSWKMVVRMHFACFNINRELARLQTLLAKALKINNYNIQYLNFQNSNYSKTLFYINSIDSALKKD